MRLIKIIGIVFLLSFSVSSKANDSLTLAQAYINLSLTDEYFDTLSAARISKILPFIEDELSTIRDTGFISKNSQIYHFTYALMYTTKARFFFRTKLDNNRQELLQWKTTLDKAVDHFNLSKIDAYFTVEKEKNSFYEFVKFDKESCFDLFYKIRGLKYNLAAYFNLDIYPDFKRIFYAAKNESYYCFDSLSYYTGLYNIPLSMSVVNNKPDIETYYSRYELFIPAGYRTAIGLDVISKYMQFLYMAREKKVSSPAELNLHRLYESWDNLMYILKPEDSLQFYYDDQVLQKDNFFNTEMNTKACDDLYALLQQKYPYEYRRHLDDLAAGAISDYYRDKTRYYFPIPVPFPSAFRYTANFKPNLKTMQQVDNYLAGIFNRAGYKGNLHYYYVNPGFAMTTSLEKINKDGSPVSGSTRWSASIGDNNSFSFYDVFKSIFFDTKSDYRMFALVVSIRGAGIQSSPSSIGAMQELIKYSYPSLPGDIKNVTLKYKTLSAFAYLFHQSDVGEVPMLDVSRRLSMETHLRKSGLADLLKN